ncbi:MAG: hypothetical protein KDD11_12935 [Acidobacteria bacterium]|nr:hypothetical protein [Acidobacteriota bacterium]
MREEQTRLHLARELMDVFAQRTGLTGGGSPRRYLWTDAFAVCNFLGLYRSTGEGGYLELALRLVDQVHHTLGRHRQDDPRKGWIAGGSDAEGERHPTRGGLRIGKEHPERRADQRIDPQLEWDRDGQYYHYLTKWMVALERVGDELRDSVFHRWAAELALAAHRGFCHFDPSLGRPRLVWKMSIALDRALVPSMGHHDPLDGLITYLEIEARASDAEGAHLLDREIAELEVLCTGARWDTDDALGIGGLLTDAYRLGRLVVTEAPSRVGLLRQVLADGRASLAAFAPARTLDAPAERRLAFRELGLAIGLAAARRLAEMPHLPEPSDDLAAITAQAPLGTRIERFWSDPANRAGRTWREHVDINSVMLATSLLPDELLGLPRRSVAP